MDNNVYRTIWISDLHLGSTQCQADVLLNFLKHNDSEKLYLVGDVIDFWSLSKKMYWPKDHTVIQKVLRKARHGTQIMYIPGNHDEKYQAIRQLCLWRHHRQKFRCACHIHREAISDSPRRRI